jgi:formylglycine-generating enzyme required for sulfatase activity
MIWLKVFYNFSYLDIVNSHTITITIKSITMKFLKIILLCFVSISILFAKPPERKLKKILKGFKFIPAGKAIVNQKYKDVDQFYIAETEVSNQTYQNFLAFLSQKGNITEVKIAKYNTENVQDNDSTVRKFDSNYASFPGFQKYPVVHITYEAAMIYCKWLEGDINEQLAGEATVEVRLPTESEWIRAARGDKHYSLFPWGGPRLKNGKGNYLANFDVDLAPKVASSLTKPNTGFISTAEVDSYFQNENGLYNVSGNVAEMLNEKGKCKGGSWATDGKSCEIDTTINYFSPSPSLGFRPVVIVKR